jgi:hypothetical protein
MFTRCTLRCRQLLAQMVRYHMLPQPLTTGNMTAGQALRTSLAGHSLKVSATSPQVPACFQQRLSACSCAAWYTNKPCAVLVCRAQHCNIVVADTWRGR